MCKRLQRLPKALSIGNWNAPVVYQSHYHTPPGPGVRYYYQYNSDIPVNAPENHLFRKKKQLY